MKASGHPGAGPNLTFVAWHLCCSRTRSDLALHQTLAYIHNVGSKRQYFFDIYLQKKIRHFCSTRKYFKNNFSIWIILILSNNNWLLFWATATFQNTKYTHHSVVKKCLTSMQLTLQWSSLKQYFCRCKLSAKKVTSECFFESFRGRWKTVCCRSCISLIPVTCRPNHVSSM
jgi:hypothetical protein